MLCTRARVSPTCTGWLTREKSQSPTTSLLEKGASQKGVSAAVDLGQVHQPRGAVTVAVHVARGSLMYPSLRGLCSSRILLCRLAQVVPWLTMLTATLKSTQPPLDLQIQQAVTTTRSVPQCGGACIAAQQCQLGQWAKLTGWDGLA